MEQWLVKKGNTSIQDIPVYQKDGTTLVDNLDAVGIEIKFQIKKKKTDAVPLVEKGNTLPLVGIEVNTPDPGYLRITLLPVDTGTTLSVGDYFMAIQIKWSATEIYEIIITIEDVKTERFRIKQDII